MSTQNKRRTPPYGGRALPLPPPRLPFDSTPTPVLELGYRHLHSRFLLLASRFESHALVCGTVGPNLDTNLQKECRRIADNIRHIAKRILKWAETDSNENPIMSKEALAAEKSWAAEQYIEFVTIAQEIMGNRLNLNG